MSTATSKRQSGLPYAVALGEGRTLIVELAPDEYEHDSDGNLLIRPSGVRRLDKVRAAATDFPDHPSPGWIKTLRATLGVTQLQLAQQLDVDKLSVSRWERGQSSPSRAAVAKLRKLRRRCAAKGIVIAA